MRLDETTRLLAETRAVYPGMSIVPGIADAWLGILGDLTFAECHNALVRLGKTQSHIPAPADIRRLVLADRQDTAMRALPSGDTDLVQKPEWFDAVMRQALEETREKNRQREERGERPTFGQTITKPSDHRPGGRS